MTGRLPARPSSIGTVRKGTSRISQVVTLVAVIVPPLGILSAMGVLWGVAFHWTDLLVLAGFYVLCAFGTTVGFHRAGHGFAMADGECYDPSLAEQAWSLMSNFLARGTLIHRDRVNHLAIPYNGAASGSQSLVGGCLTG